MPIRIQCPGCKKALAVKEQLAGKKASCPVCRTSFTIPKPKPKPQLKPADLEAEAAAALGMMDQPEEEQKPQFVEMECPFCEEEIKFPAELNGKREPCPSCRNLLQVPRLEDDQQKTWRDMKRAGPAGAKINQQEKLEGAWGSTIDRDNVSRESLEEADAFPIEVADPIGVGGWIKRVFYVGVVVAAVVGAGYWFMNYMGNVRELSALETAQTAFEEAEKNQADAEALPRSWRAVFFYETGKYHQAKNEPKLALENFNKARFHFPTVPGAKNHPRFDEELLLADIAEGTVGLGGNEDQVIDKIRLPWEDLQDELRRMIIGIYSPDGQWLALRRVCYRLIDAKQEGLTLSLTNQVASSSRAGSDLFEAQKLALLLALKQDDQAKAIAELPEKGKITELMRYGYATGYGLLGDFDKAKEVARREGLVKARIHKNMELFKASLVVAELALVKGKKEVAKESLDYCYSLLTRDGLNAALSTKDRVTDSLPLLLCHMGQMTEQLQMPKKTKQIEGMLEFYQKKNLKTRHNLAALMKLAELRQLAKASTPIDANALQDRTSLAYIRALVLEGQQKTQTGNVASLSAAMEPKYRPFVLIGATLGLE